MSDFVSMLASQVTPVFNMTSIHENMAHLESYAVLSASSIYGNVADSHALHSASSLYQNLGRLNSHSASAIFHTVLVASPIWIAAAIVVRLVYFSFFHPLAKIPGPFLASLSRLWLVYHALGGRQHEVHMAIHQKYGPVVRVTPNTVIINDPDHFHEYFGFDKSEWWLAMRAESGHVPHGFEMNQKLHNLKKKRVAGGFSITYNLKNEDKVDDMIRYLIGQLSSKFASTGAICDMAIWMQYAAMDTIMQMVFSSPPGFLQQGKDVNNLIGGIHALLNAGQVISQYPQIMKVLHLPLINPLLAPQPTDKTGPGVIAGFAYKQVRERLSDGDKGTKRDVLQAFVDYRDREGENIHPKVLENEAVGPVLAGSDTTSTVLRNCILYLSTNNRVRNKLIEEIDCADAQGLLSSPIKFDEVKKHIPYMELIFKEGLRIRPVTGAPPYRVVPKGGTVMNDYYIPGGTWIGIVHWEVSRNKKAFGDDVTVFRPERWIEGDETARRNRDKADIFFSQGSMGCTGRNIAAIQVYKMITELFRNFDFTVVEPAQPWKEINAMSFRQTEFYCLLSPRQKPWANQKPAE